MNAPSKLKMWAIVVLSLLLMVCIWASPIDHKAEKVVDQALARASVTFVTARALNGVLSVAKGTEVNLGIGIGATMSIGEILDPIDDLVERFGDLMLWASVSLLIQKMLIVMAQHWILKGMVSIVLAAWAIMLVRRQKVPTWFLSLSVLVLMAKLAIPLANLGADAVYRGFLASQYEQSSREFDSNGPLMQNNDGFFANILAKVNPAAKIQELKNTADATADRIVKLIFVFLMQTLVLPLAMLLLLWTSTRWALQAIRERAPGAPEAIELPRLKDKLQINESL